MGCATPRQLAQREVEKGYVALWEQTQPTQAIAAYQRAVTLDPNNVQAALLLAKIYDDTLELEKALVLYRELLRDYPENLGVVLDFLWFSADHAWWPVGEDETLVIQEGMAAGESALERWPDDPQLLEAHGWLCYNAGKAARAEELLQKSLAQGRTFRRLYILSIASSAVGKRAQARAAYEEASALQPREKESIYDQGFRQLAESLLQAGSQPSPE